jgi:hypothetical protein
LVRTPVGLAAPTLLHGGVGVYGICLLAMAIALHTQATPAGDSDPIAASLDVEPQPERGGKQGCRASGGRRALTSVRGLFLEGRLKG